MPSHHANVIRSIKKFCFRDFLILSLNSLPPPTPNPFAELDTVLMQNTVLLVQCNFVQTILPQYLKRV